MQNITKYLDFNFLASQWKAIAIVVLLFLLVLTLAQVRRHFIDWSIKGALFGIFIGFLLALFLEGFLIIGGKTALTEFLGWKNAPKPILIAIEAGRNKLVDVLGMMDQIPQSVASSDSTTESAIEILQSLDPSEIKKVKSLICNP
ncbi:MAG: hypothetical protein UU32_C0011G0007 [Candidatus Woesebacteria bacterium GW2011_GWB1_41_10]|uniref:Uncharacterized protein n=1 Tax=Candidatus Woesebacteria bacterium GW2011_GWB1_41_10 TaxID=1618577 RepID=A0A0G0XGA2_9BACT|nr:MAG: hypothetical protein UU32_C0011G0007 [Candidatus Woesebacteria bacterium GW2011_GWB1_41_10]